jgi:predicted alpha/beta hydrolase family esterase
MTRQVLFVHGGGEGAYAEDAKLVASLSGKLGPSYSVRYPQMPNEDEPDYQAWKQLISEELTAMGEGAILVGHSIGASVVIKFLSDEVLKGSIAGAFLIAAPFWYDDDFWKWPEVQLPKDVSARLPSGLPLFLYHGRADEVVPFEHLEMYVELLPRAIVRRLDGRNHQLNGDLTEVANDIGRLR